VALGAPNTWTGNYIPVYYFWGYAYYGDQSTVVELTPYPGDEYAHFANFPGSGQPVEEFNVSCLGGMGINTDGVPCGPIYIPPPPPQVCCVGPACYLLDDIAACNVAHGDWYEGLTSCEPNPCVHVCCIVEECVLTYSQTACAAMGGAWHGNWDSCANNPCQGAAASACCVYGECYFLSSEDCADLIAACPPNEPDCAEYFPGFRCDEGIDCTDTSDLPHVCCVGELCYLVFEDECDMMQGTWHHTWNSCWVPPGEPNPCVKPWACCVFDDCYSLTLDECDVVGGTWHAGYECADYDCADLAVCCLQNLCYLMFEDECESLTGTFAPAYDSCDPNPCPLYVCCQDNGACSILSQEECVASGGTFFSGVETCSPNPCPVRLHVCCVPSGDSWYCQELLEADCEAIEGAMYHSTYNDCDSVDCADPVAVCCIAGSCLENLWEEECIARDGVWLADSTSCDPNPCGPPVVGACCFYNSCYMATQDSCETDIGGEWHYDDYVDCDPNQCIVVGAACCLPNGECVVEDSLACSILEGEWHRESLTCTPGLCPEPEDRAVCCYGDLCYVLYESQCDYVGGTFHEGYTDCETVDCENTPLNVCCVDIACYLVWEGDCEARSGVFHPDLTACDPNPCQSPVNTVSWGRIKSLYRVKKR
jgi:hypothetical protein